VRRAFGGGARADPQGRRGTPAPSPDRRREASNTSEVAHNEHHEHDDTLDDIRDRVTPPRYLTITTRPDLPIRPDP
jgi:hypothetical protein